MRKKKKEPPKSYSKLKDGCSENQVIFVREILKQEVMTKNQMKYALSLGGEFNLEVDRMEMGQVQSFVEAAVKGGGKINLLKTERLTVAEIQLLCEKGGCHVAFPDMKFTD